MIIHREDMPENAEETRKIRPLLRGENRAYDNGCHLFADITRKREQSPLLAIDTVHIRKPGIAAAERAYILPELLFGNDYPEIERAEQISRRRRNNPGKHDHCLCGIPLEPGCGADHHAESAGYQPVQPDHTFIPFGCSPFCFITSFIGVPAKSNASRRQFSI